jgi:hypothetical protein
MKCRAWLTAIFKHSYLIQAIEMVFCDVHETKLKVEAKPRSDVYFDVNGTQNIHGTRKKWDAPVERCPALKKFNEVEHELRDLFSSAGRNGLSAKDYICAANLLFTGHSRFDCT